MTAALLRIDVVPKTCLTKAEAARYCGRSVKQFETECPVLPVMFANGDRRYHTADLDSWISSKKAQSSDIDSLIEALGDD